MNDLVDLVNLNSLFGPARDQGQRPTCLAFAASDAHAALINGWSPLSCEYAFYQAQKLSGRTPNSGALLSTMLEVIKTVGQPEEASWPYLPATPSETEVWHPPSSITEKFYRNSRHSSIKIDSVITELDQGRPVIILLMLSRSFYNPSERAIIDALPTELPDHQRRHAVIAFGHGRFDGERIVLIRNSWGTSWGQLGNGWLTERFLTPRIYAAAVLTEKLNVPASSTSA